MDFIQVACEDVKQKNIKILSSYTKILPIRHFTTTGTLSSTMFYLLYINSLPPKCCHFIGVPTYCSTCGGKEDNFCMPGYVYDDDDDDDNMNHLLLQRFPIYFHFRTLWQPISINCTLHISKMFAISIVASISNLYVDAYP
jgi:hypothetical protein